jgi:DNA invertase Pin-like site-specific DNA recombinase
MLEFVDVGVSGTQRRRPQLDALMQAARRRQFDTVVAWKFDRFARFLKHLLDALEEFHALGIDFISLTEGIDTTTPTGQLLFGIFGAAAQFERDLIVERGRALPRPAAWASRLAGRGSMLTRTRSFVCEAKTCPCAGSRGDSTFRSRACGAP